MNLSTEDKEYLHATFVSRTACNECTTKIRKELADGATSFATIKQDLNYIKEKLDKKSKFSSATASSVIQAVCAVLVAYMAAKLGLQ